MTIIYNIDREKFTREELITGLNHLIEIIKILDIVALSKEYLGERLNPKTEELFDQIFLLIKELSVDPTQELIDRYNKIINLFKEEVHYTNLDNWNIFTLVLERSSYLSNEAKNKMLNVIEESKIFCD